MPRYAAVPGVGIAVLRKAVGVAERARVDRRHAQETEACAIQLDVAGNLTCEMHGALHWLEHYDDIR